MNRSGHHADRGYWRGCRSLCTCAHSIELAHLMTHGSISRVTQCLRHVATGRMPYTRYRALKLSRCWRMDLLRWQHLVRRGGDRFAPEQRVHPPSDDHGDHHSIQGDSWLPDSQRHMIGVAHVALPLVTDYCKWRPRSRRGTTYYEPETACGKGSTSRGLLSKRIGCTRCAVPKPASPAPVSPRCRVQSGCGISARVSGDTARRRSLPWQRAPGRAAGGGRAHRMSRTPVRSVQHARIMAHADRLTAISLPPTHIACVILTEAAGKRSHEQTDQQTVRNWADIRRNPPGNGGPDWR